MISGIQMSKMMLNHVCHTSISEKKTFKVEAVLKFQTVSLA